MKTAFFCDDHRNETDIKNGIYRIKKYGYFDPESGDSIIADALAMGIIYKLGYETRRPSSPIYKLTERGLELLPAFLALYSI